MTIEEKKAYLSSYVEQKQRIEKAWREYDRTFIEETSASSVNLEHSTAGNRTAHGLEVYAAKRDKLARKIIKLQNERLSILSDITWNIEQITDIDPRKAEEYRNILYYRYIEGLKWDTIADILGRSRQHIDRKHGEALKRFTVIVDTISGKPRTDEP